MNPFEYLQGVYDAIGAKFNYGAVAGDYKPEDHIWAHYMKGILIGYERRHCAFRKMKATLCEEINKPTESMKVLGKHGMYTSHGYNMKCLPYHDHYSMCKYHAPREVELKCSDPWKHFQQALMKQDQKKAALRGSPEKWFEAGIDMHLRIPTTRAEKMGPRYAPDLRLPAYVPKNPYGSSLGDTLGDEVDKRFRILSVCMLAKDQDEHMRDEQISQLNKPPVTAFDAQKEMLEGRGNKEKMGEVLLGLREEKAEALAKGEHWGKRHYKKWADVEKHPIGYTREIFERRRIANKEEHEIDP